MTQEKEIKLCEDVQGLKCDMTSLHSKLDKFIDSHEAVMGKTIDSKINAALIKGAAWFVGAGSALLAWTHLK